MNIWWASKSGTVAFVDSNGWCSLWFSSSYMVNPIWQKGAWSHFILKDTMVGSDASLLIHWNQRCFFLSKIWVPVFLPTTWTLEITSLLPSRGCARHGLIHPTTWSTAARLVYLRLPLQQPVWSFVDGGWVPLPSEEWRFWKGKMINQDFQVVYFWNIIFGMTNAMSTWPHPPIDVLFYTYFLLKIELWFGDVPMVGDE